MFTLTKKMWLYTKIVWELFIRRDNKSKEVSLEVNLIKKSRGDQGSEVTKWDFCRHAAMDVDILFVVLQHAPISWPACFLNVLSRTECWNRSRLTKETKKNARNKREAKHKLTYNISFVTHLHEVTAKHLHSERAVQRNSLLTWQHLAL